MKIAAATPRSAQVRFAIDTGGTFTDIVVVDEVTGEFSIDKVPTTPADRLIGVMNAIRKARVDLESVSRFFVHGSTTALNAMLERKGVPTGFITTAGFRDVPEIARYNRPEMYNPKYRKPPQIVPRELRFEVAERINTHGEVLVPLDEAQVRQVARRLKVQGVRAIAVCLLHSFKNALHERRTREIVLEEFPEASVAISSDIAPEHREYERGMTTILNAYLAPVVERWLGAMDAELRRHCFAGEFVLTKSDGGGMTSEFAKSSPINTLLSGPAGGVIGGMQIAAVTPFPNLITMDMGGTSFDVAMIKEGRANTNQETRVCGFPVLIPNLDIRTIGAGGGSIAWIDGAGALHVGPQSAGAEPGPVCYSRGGVEPTVTDAAVCSGYIDPKNFLGGEMRLDRDGALNGIRTRIGQPLGLEWEEAASGILRIALSNMAEAIKDITSESGADPRDFALLCFGGGGPLFGAYLMEELAIPAAIVPVAPANFSAWGMLMVDLRHDVVKTIARKLERLGAEDLRSAFAGLTATGNSLLEREGVAAVDRSFVRTLDMRYCGQEHTVAVSIAFEIDDAFMNRVYEEFQRTYRDVYGYTLPAPADVVNARVKAIGRIPKPTLQKVESGSEDASPAYKGTRRVFDFMSNSWIKHRIYARSLMRANNRVAGPAIVEEATTLTPIRSDQFCVVDEFGNLVIRGRSAVGRLS